MPSLYYSMLLLILINSLLSSTTELSSTKTKNGISTSLPHAFSVYQPNHSISEFTAKLPIELLRDSVINYASFDEVVQMRMVNQEFYNTLTPYFHIKEQCGLDKEDIWPPQMLRIKEIDDVQFPNCLNILKQHSHMYQEASITVPMIHPLASTKFINALNLVNSLTITFPDYHDYISDKPVSTQNRINSSQIMPFLERIEENTGRSIKIQIMYTIYYISGSNWDDEMPHVLGSNLVRLSIESLEILDVIFNTNDDTKFEALYEAISKSKKLKNLKLESAQVRSGESEEEIIQDCIFPTSGFENLKTSSVTTLSLFYDHDDFDSPLETILNGLPKNLEELEV